MMDCTGRTENQAIFTFLNFSVYLYCIYIIIEQNIILLVFKTVGSTKTPITHN